MRLRFQSWAKLLRRSVLISASGVGTFCGICIYTENETFYRNLMSSFHWTNPEFGHRAAVWSLKHGLVMRTKMVDSPSVTIRLWGLEFKNPVGIAAGFDKHGEAVLGLDKLGFGFVEVGSVTRLPQQGNTTPRVFRLKEDQAVINRYGFNSVGHEEVYNRLEAMKKTGRFGGVLGVNLGKNKLSLDAAGDYVAGVEKFGDVCDYLVINISSPNTPGLRSLQGRRDLSLLLRAVLEARSNLKSQPPILVKIAPDLTDMDKADIAEIIAGASLVQLYSAIVYQGPTVVNRVRRELEQLLSQNGFHSLEEAVGNEFKEGFDRAKEAVKSPLKEGFVTLEEAEGAQCKAGFDRFEEAVGKE